MGGGEVFFSHGVQLRTVYAVRRGERQGRETLAAFDVDAAPLKPGLVATYVVDAQHFHAPDVTVPCRIVESRQSILLFSLFTKGTELLHNNTTERERLGYWST